MVVIIGCIGVYLGVIHKLMLLYVSYIECEIDQATKNLRVPKNRILSLKRVTTGTWMSAHYAVTNTTVNNNRPNVQPNDNIYYYYILISYYCYSYNYNNKSL